MHFYIHAQQYPQQPLHFHPSTNAQQSTNSKYGLLNHLVFIQVTTRIIAKKVIGTHFVEQYTDYRLQMNCKNHIHYNG